MLKIEVAGSYIKHVKGSKGDNAGKEFDIPMVEAYAQLEGERYPVRCDYSLGKGDKAPAPGLYFVGPGSFYCNEYGSLAIRRTLHLIPAPAAQKAV